MSETTEGALQNQIAVAGMYENWFLEYASYVILERAVPAVEDGLKPVQRRILHAMKEMDDGRFNKVANIIGQSMQYHPHGDASIGDALVNIGQKNLLVETQGNWGDVRTGDDAGTGHGLADDESVDLSLAGTFLEGAGQAGGLGGGVGAGGAGGSI